MTDSTEEILVEHSLNPRNTEPLESDPTHKSEAENPACGDTLSLELVIEDDTVVAVRVRPEGCAVSKASASLFSELVVGKTKEEMLEVAEKLSKGLKDGNFAPELEELSALESLSKFPLRHRCVLLPHEAFAKAVS